MTHLFRPAEPYHARPNPQLSIARKRLAVVVRQLLPRLAHLFSSPLVRAMSVRVLLLLGLVLQGALILTAAYLIDLSVSLMELWAELARKHLELTM